MDSEDFAPLFAALQKSAETARSAFYAFVIVYAAMLFYAMNTYVYPISQHLFSSVRDEISSGRDCDPGHVGPLCLNASAPFDKLNADYAAHVLEYFQDRSTDERVFHVPLIGLNSDRNWFWLINLAGSFLLYTLIRGALQKYHSLLAYLFEENRQQTSRVVLLNTTQIITAGDPPSGRSRGQDSSFWSESFAIRCLLLMPIIVSATIIFDWLYLLCTADDRSAFLRQSAALIGFIVTVAALWWQVRMFQRILATIYRLFEVDRLKQRVLQDATSGDGSAA